MKAEIYPIFLPNKGVAGDMPEELLPDQVSPYSRNMEYFNELIQARLGLEKFDSAVLSGRIMEQFRFVKANNDAFNLFFTPKDIYAYDFSSLRFDILTPTYTTGTIEILSGTPTVVTGASTVWSTNLKAGDYIKIGATGIHTGSTWYEILTVDTNTQLTLTTSAASVSAGSAYVARKIFVGGNNDLWDCVKFTDSSLGDIVVATNGVDTPIYWTGSNQVVSVTGLPNTMKAKYVTAYKDRIVWAWTVEGGSNQPERVRLSDVANVNSYTTILFEDLIDDGSGITGLINFGGYIVLTKETVFYLGRWVGGTNVNDYDPIAGPTGCKSHRSLVVDKQWLYYYGYDKKFHRWNLVTDQILTEGIFAETKDFDPVLERHIYGFNVYHKNQIRWFCPHQSSDYNDYTVVFDYNNESIQVWDCGQAQALMSAAFYLLQTDLYLDDAIWGDYYLDEQVGYWDDFSYLQSAPIFIYGGYDGYVRKCDISELDDGTAYTRTLKFKKLNFKLPHFKKRLWKQQWWFEQEASGSVTLKHYLDNDDLASVNTDTIQLTESGKEITKPTVVIDLHAENFQPEITSTNFFSLLGVINYFFKKRRSF